MERSEPCFDLVDPKEPRVNAALMHVLESKKIDSIPARL
jgi:hypothetical protein